MILHISCTIYQFSFVLFLLQISVCAISYVFPTMLRHFLELMWLWLLRMQMQPLIFLLLLMPIKAFNEMSKLSTAGKDVEAVKLGTAIDSSSFTQCLGLFGDLSIVRNLWSGSNWNPAHLGGVCCWVVAHPARIVTVRASIAPNPRALNVVKHITCIYHHRHLHRYNHRHHHHHHWCHHPSPQRRCQ